ncbi:MAG TPA: crosslink repair DNA glycosylase YcaQ family protein [Candidatus Limnocylindrales bacterium]|nr:crosslink repair DNA glycosylase YcaQ family protein [Candidatus Limnocylindrales bacterium]
MATLTIDRATARRFLVRRHLLAPPRSLPAGPDSVKRVLERLGSLQFDPLEVAGRNHDLVLAARIADYERRWTDALLYDERWLYETYNKGLSLVQTAELPWFRHTWDQNHDEHAASTFVEHGPLVDELLGRIRRDGPLAATDVEPRAAIDWYWRPTNQVRAVLEALAEAGILGLARRDGNRRVYDLAERLFPAALLAVRPTPADQLRHRLLSRYRAHGLLGARGGQAEIWVGTGRTAAERDAIRSALVGSGDLIPVEVEGIRGIRHALAGERDLLDAAARSVAGADQEPVAVAFLAPLDPFLWDRDLLRSLFDFDYVWEVYVPAAKRRWGYYVLPILAGDRLVGRIEPRIDRRAGALRILGLWWEDGFDPLAADGFVEALVAALRAHARFADVERVVWPRAVRHRALGGAVRERLGPAGRIRGGSSR